MAQRRLPAAQQVQVAERFPFPDGHRTVAGYMARTGRTYAHVVTDEGTEVHVSYRLLSRDLGTSWKNVQSHTDTLRAQWHAGDQVRFAVGTETPHADVAPRARQRTDDALQAIAARASAWIAAHRLTGWSFQFDHGTKRAGCCNYRTRVISLAHAYARSAADEAIDDTLLREIAHALV